VTSVVPNQGFTTGGTTVSINGAGFCNTTSAVDFGSKPAAAFSVQSDTLITAVTSPDAAATVDVQVTTLAGPSATGAAGDQFTFVAPPGTSACTTSQYHLTGSDGATWADMDAANLTISFTPPANSWAILGGNADLWTSSTGYNQDIGIAVVGGTAPAYPTAAGQPEAWKESGGFAGTFSPNAAYVQSAIRVQKGISYTARLVWKANHPDAGSIWAGAGPISTRYSPTCINFRLVPFSQGAVVSRSSPSHYLLVGSDGATWNNVDAPSLSFSYVVPSDGVVLVSGNGDLWTSTPGFNQDFGISLSGGGYPTTAGQPEAWKESGGFGGTFSPNAAFVQAVLPVTSGATITASLVWKVNHADSGAIFLGAGPILVGAVNKYSPTSLTLVFLPIASAPIDQVSTLQYKLAGSDGATWQTVNFSKFTIPITPANDCQVIISGNADLWTANAGYNQDLGVSISGGQFPTFPGQPEAWKESGGLAGTFSPNAAYVQIVEDLSAGQTYAIQLVWKTNQFAAGTRIFTGAGPVAGGYSPTRLTVQPIGC
jgi:hypothetical protein